MLAHYKENNMSWVVERRARGVRQGEGGILKNADVSVGNLDVCTGALGEGVSTSGRRANGRFLTHGRFKRTRKAAFSGGAVCRMVALLEMTISSEEIKNHEMCSSR